MSFVTNFKTIIEGDVSLNSLVTGGIKFSHLPEDFDISKTWVAWDYKIVEQIDTIECNNVYSNYSISITLTATDTVIMNTMSDYLRDYLNSKTTTNFVDIHFINEGKITTLTRASNAYQNTLEFMAIYVP